MLTGLRPEKTIMKNRNKQQRKHKELKTKGPQPRANRQQEKPVLSATVSLAKNLSKRVWQIFGGIALVVGFVAIFYPRISVSPSSSLDPQSPLLTPFVISNDGNIDLTDIKYMLGMRNIKFVDGREFTGETNFTSRFTGPNNTIAKLSVGEKSTILSPLQFNPGGAVDFADVAIVVGFKPSFLPIKMEKVFRFITSKGNNGKLNWYAQPLSKDDPKISHLYRK